MSYFPSNFSLSAKQLIDHWIPYANEEEKRKAEALAEQERIKASKIGKQNNKSTLSKEGTSSSRGSLEEGGSGYKAPSLNTKAPKTAPPKTPKTDSAASTFKNTYGSLLNPTPPGTTPALDALANMKFPEEVDLTDDDPFHQTKQIAKNYLDKNTDKMLNLNRIDLGPAMALADAWMKGKSNLAGSYRPPETNDSMMVKMMRLMEESQKNSDDSELRKSREKTNTISKLYVEPRKAIASMVSGLVGLDKRAQASILTTIAKLTSDAALTDSRLQAMLDRDVNANRTRIARDEADAKNKYQRLKLQRERWSTGQNAQKRNEWAKQEREESKMLAGKLLGIDINNEKTWKSSDRGWHQFTRNLADKLVVDHDLVEQTNGDYHAATMLAYQMLRDNFDAELDAFPYLPVVDGIWQKFREENKKTK